MTEHQASKFVWICFAAAMVVASFSYQPLIARGEDWTDTLVSDDIYIRGNQINAFTDGDESVSVVVGEFRLVIGGRVITGNEAVIWISQPPSAPETRHDLTIYVRGDVRISDPAGGVTTDDVALLTIQQAGQLVSKGEISTESVSGSPLYQRALEARKAESPATINPEVAPEPLDGITPSQIAPEPKPDDMLPPVPINFHFDSFSSTVHGSRRYTIAHGNVYISRGAPSSNEFVELTGQSAVLISEKRPIRQVNVPWATKMEGVATDLPGPQDMPETLTGVYLEGDVIIRRGEQMMRSSSAYYDLGSDRALIIDPVFRTVQAQREIPIYIRADEARLLSIREWWFKNARTTSSDMFSPSYHIGASQAYLMDTTPYDELGVRLGERSMSVSHWNATFNIGSVPIMYSPFGTSDFQQGHTALRNVNIAHDGDEFGWGVETDWHLFSLFGLVKPEGFTGKYELDVFQRGFKTAVELDYERPAYSGYAMGVIFSDQVQLDSFGDERKDIAAPEGRGRLQFRHKQFLPKDWQVQLELSYLSDRNFLEQFYYSEFSAGKDQETLIYARKQKDNWAFTSLMKYRLNRFQTQFESLPDLGLFLIGEPLVDDQLTYFGQTNAGFLRLKFANVLKEPDSNFFPRINSRHEIDWPVKLGPINIVPYAVGRLSYLFEEEVFDGADCRQYGQVGIKANTHIWRIHESVSSRLWDLNKIKHIITPEVVAFVADEIGPGKGVFGPLFRLGKNQLSGLSVGIHQRWQTKRGQLGEEEIVDWLRWDVDAAWFYNQDERFQHQVDGEFIPTADGKFFFSRPENSTPRNHIRSNVMMALSDSTSILADVNYDLHSDTLRRANAGLSVVRNPRFSYYLGGRYIEESDSMAATVGMKYKINSKYSIDVLEQYDFKFEGGQSSATTISLTRKMERWYATFTYAYAAANKNTTFFVSIWHEGLPEAPLESGGLNLLGESSKN